MSFFDKFKKKKAPEWEQDSYNRQEGYINDGYSQSAPPQSAGMQQAAADMARYVSAMMVEDVFTITGRGTVVTGKVERGSFEVSDRIDIVREGVVISSTAIEGIEAFRKLLDRAETGDNVGILLRGVAKNDVARFDVICR